VASTHATSFPLVGGAIELFCVQTTGDSRTHARAVSFAGMLAGCRSAGARNQQQTRGL